MTALYCRLSDDDDDKDLESNSIINQKAILQDYAKRNGYLPIQIFTDDGISGLTFNRPGFREMEALVEGRGGTNNIYRARLLNQPLAAKEHACFARHWSPVATVQC